jgi:UDP-glucose 4-epimerase
MTEVILVTGGAGFIGSHLVDSLLADGFKVRVLDDLSSGRRGNLDARAELVIGDVADRAGVRTAMAGITGVFHLAAVASVARGNEDWLGTHRTNQSGTIAILEAARMEAMGKARAVPVIYASSAAVYGDTGQEAAHERMVPNPETAYGADKLGSELHARVGSRIHGVPNVGLRFFNVYGPRQDPASPYSGVISIFARKAAERATITLHGDGAQTRDFVHVSDVVRHLRAAMGLLLSKHATAGNGAAFSTVLNVCTGRAVSIRELALMLGRLHRGVPRTEHSLARPGDIRHSRGQWHTAEAILGLRATVALEDGLTTLMCTDLDVTS